MAANQDQKTQRGSSNAFDCKSNFGLVRFPTTKHHLWFHEIDMPHAHNTAWWLVKMVIASHISFSHVGMFLWLPVDKSPCEPSESLLAVD